MITAEELKSRFHYDASTGIFTHLRDHRGHARKGDIAGTLNSCGYVVIKVDGKRYTAHRLAVLYMTGIWPPHQVDHINHVRDDNRYANLRLATNGENACNSRLRKTSRSGHKGVSWDARTGKWLGIINHQRVRHYVGTYESLDEAVQAVSEKRTALHAEFAHHT